MSNLPMTNAQGALANLETNWGYAAFVELEGGDILWGYGWNFRTSGDGGLSWSEPSRRPDTNGLPVMCQGLVNLPGSGIGCVSCGYYDKDDGSKHLHHGQLFFWRSEDAGRTWQPPIAVTQPGAHNQLLPDSMVRTSSGRILIPAYIHFGQKIAARPPGTPTAPGPQRIFEGLLYHNQFVSNSAHYHDPTFCASTVFYSDDEGQTWQQTRSNYMPITIEFSGPYHWTDEPAIAEISPNNLLMFHRTLLGRLYQSWSYDDGETWTRPQPTQLAADNSPAKLVTLPDTNHLLCVWNQHSEEEVRRGLTRMRLSSAVSRTEGLVWEFFQNVESILEETWVPPGAIRVVRPENAYNPSGEEALVRDPNYLQRAPEGFGRWSYPSVLVYHDRVLVHHSYTKYDRQARRVPPGYGSRLKVLPIQWFYGETDPGIDVPDLPYASRAAVP